MYRCGDGYNEHVIPDHMVNFFCLEKMVQNRRKIAHLKKNSPAALSRRFWHRCAAGERTYKHVCALV